MYTWEVSASGSSILERRQIADVSKSQQVIKTNQKYRSCTFLFFVFLKRRLLRHLQLTIAIDVYRSSDIASVFLSADVDLRCFPRAHHRVQNSPVIRDCRGHLCSATKLPPSLFQTENPGRLGIGLVFSLSWRLEK